MTLEAAKEMDRRCVLVWLYDIYCNPTVAFDTYSDEQQREFAHDALVLLKEQEPAEPIIDQKVFQYARCEKCGQVLHWQGDCYHWCGRQVKWE